MSLNSDTILKFIKVFQDDTTKVLFQDVACYWFALILHHRFSNSFIVYNPNIMHFATSISDTIYDITGEVENPEDYIDWREYASQYEDAHLVEECCIQIVGNR